MHTGGERAPQNYRWEGPVLQPASCKLSSAAEMPVWGEAGTGDRGAKEREMARWQETGRGEHQGPGDFCLLQALYRGNREPSGYLKEKGGTLRLQFHRETTTASSHLNTQAATQACK